MFPRDLNVEGTLKVEGKQNSLFPEGPVIKCFVIPPDSTDAVQGGEFTFPWFTKVENRMGAFFGERKEITSSCLRLTKFDVEVKEENIDFNVTKSKWYDMLRGRFHSSLTELTDEEIEEGIDELQRGKLKDLKPQDDISISSTLLVFIARKN